MMKLLLVSLALIVRSAVSQGEEEQQPGCQMCGCSYCEEGAYPMENPTGFIDILEWVATYEHLHDQNTTIEEALGDEFPFTHLPCSVLEMAAVANEGEEICIDLFRMNPLMRNVCGCPPLPPPPPGFENPFEDEETASMPEDTAPEEPSSTEEGTFVDNEEGSPYPPVVTERKNKSTPILILALGFFLVLVGAAALGIFTYTKRRGAASDDQVLSMKTPDSSIA